jgi:hypothetical protein
VKWLNLQSAQDHHFESAGEKITWFVGFHRCGGGKTGWFSLGLDQNSLEAQVLSRWSRATRI